MKYFLILIAMIILSGSVQAQDSVFVTINNDTVNIWNTGAYENCGFTVVFETIINNDTITIIEKDTLGVMVYCMCTFDFCAALTGLNPGNYYVEVYRQYYVYEPDTIYYVGSTDFTYNGPSSIFSELYYQSECYNIQSITDQDVIPDNYLTIRNYPNPFNTNTTIRYSLPFPSFVSLKVYDILGKEITTLINDIQEGGSHVTYFDGSSLSSGIYFCRIATHSGKSINSRYMNKTIKIILMK